MSETLALGDVAEVIRGVTYAGSDARSGPTSGAVPILRAGNIGDSLDIANDLLWVDSMVVSPAQRLRVGDVAICMSSGSPSVVGKSAILSEPFDGSVGAFCAIVRARHGLDPAYLGQYLRSPGFWSWRDSSARGVGIQNLKVSDLLTLAIPLPPLDEQRRIATRLRDRLAHIDSVQVACAERTTSLQQLRTTALEEAFAGVEAPPMPLVAAVREPEAITDGPFGSHLKTDHYSLSGVRVIRLQNIGTGAFLGADEAFVSAEHAAGLGRHRAVEGDVVVAALGDGARPAGRACIVPDLGPAIVKADCFRIRTAGSALDREFLMWFMNSPATQGSIASMMRGATRPRVTLAMLKSLPIPVPAMIEQRRIAGRLREQLAEIDRAKAALAAQRAAAEALPAAFLREVFGASTTGG